MPRTHHTTRRLMRVLASPISTWPAKIARLSDDDRQQLDADAAALAQLAARLSSYTSRVHTAGHTRKGKIPPHIHQDAVRRQNTTAARVRRALGYFNARHDLTF